MKRCTLLALVMCISLLGMAQEKNSTPKFAFSAGGGLQWGTNKSRFTGEAFSGIYYKNWIGGLGGNYSGYGKPSVPLFGGIRKKINLSKKYFVLPYGNAGVNLVPKETINNEWEHRFNNNGRYFEAGVGIGNSFSKSSVSVSFGYSFKDYDHKVENVFNQPTGAYYFTKTEYKYNTYVLKLVISNF